MKIVSKEELHNELLSRHKQALSISRFYHYTSLEVGLDKILIGAKIRFTHPKNFNDPFDCNELLLHHKTTNEEFKEGMLDSSLYQGLDRRAKRRIRRDYEKHDSTKRVLAQEKKKYRIACFSEVSDEVLMWSHYADRHSGVCIGFDFPLNYEDRFILVPVNYESRIEPFSGLANNLEVILHWLTTKSKRWDYEKEVRAIMKTDKVNSEYDFQEIGKREVKELIFGCNISGQKISESLKNIKKAGYPLNSLEVKRMSINPRTFLLKTERVQ